MHPGSTGLGCQVGNLGYPRQDRRFLAHPLPPDGTVAQEGFASQRPECHRRIPLLCRCLAVALPQLLGTSGIARWLPDLSDTAPGRTRPAGTYAPAGIYRDIGDRRGEILALNDSGTLSRIRGDLGQARSYH
jgi:hypothetical protein